jgi:hypothetical protein
MLPLKCLPMVVHHLSNKEDYHRKYQVILKTEVDITVNVMYNSLEILGE